MIITKRLEFVGTHKQHSLDPDLTIEQIEAALGGIESSGPSADVKCLYEWDFYADGHPCGIWDYRGSRWSAYGPREVFEKLGLSVVS